MDYLQSVQAQATYNQWINQRLFDASERLTEDERNAELGAFFGSISGTLNHLVVGDSIWLRRLLNTDVPANDQLRDSTLQWLPKPATLDAMLFTQWSELRSMRESIDQFIMDWSRELRSQDLDVVLSYTNTQGRPYADPLGLLLVHFFNHQTHHRGQVSTLLFQNGVDPGDTDLILTIRN